MYTEASRVTRHPVVGALPLLLLALFSPAGAQQGQPPPAVTADRPCPTITIDCPTEITDPPVFKANVSGLVEGQKINYSWSVNNARIVSGQGTPAVVFESEQRGRGAGGSVTATVTVGGLPAGCTSSASCTMIWDEPPSALRFDSYGAISPGEERERLDRFAAKLRETPGATARLVAYGRMRGRVGRAVKYLIGRCGVEAGRISVSRGMPWTETAMELYVVPAGAVPPEASQR